MESAMRSYRRNILLIVLLSFMFAAAMGFYTYGYEPDVYASTVGLYVLPSGTDNAAISEMLASDAALLLQNPEILAKAEEELSPDSLDGMRITLEGVKGTHILQITAFGTNPSLCQRAATAVSTVFMEQMQTVTNVLTISVAKQAEFPMEPVAPRRILKILLTCAIAFVAISALWLLFAPKKRRVCASDALEGVAPVLGSVSDFRGDIDSFFNKKKSEKRILSQCVNRSTIEDVKALSIALGNKVSPQRRSLVVASYQADEQRSGLTVLLASELCDQGKRVLLVDMDCYAPTIGRLLCVHGTKDLIHYLGGEATLDQITLPTAIPGLFVVDHLHEQSLVARMVAAPAFAAFVEQMQQEYDRVFFIAPPVGLFSDAAALASVLDGILLVVAQERHTQKEFENMILKLKMAGDRLVGLAFTLVPPRRVKQYRDYEESSGVRAARAARGETIS